MSDDDRENGEEPAVLPMPPVVAALFIVLIGIELAFFLGTQGIVGGPGAVGWRLAAVQRFGFSGDILWWMIETGRWPANHMIRFVSYPFVAASFTNALVAGVMLLALGKMVAEVFGAISMLLIFFVSSAVGALAYGLLAGDPYPLLGSFPAVYGMIGGYTYLMWRSLEIVGASQLRAFSLIAVLMGVQLGFGLFFDVQKDWIADLAGFLSGFVLSIVLAPGGLRALLARIRRD
ncbi:rhomboid family intramembrane serine protease [Chachezhania antarctica]|uniref:rhomboid family intramembrane serine protease n=1 Tax=Chachezhania antarctica TaxID=2340860 RepID=UPI001F097835|nr:rhomboid family intramembrane serine protease [Chachezhania antarctica]